MAADSAICDPIVRNNWDHPAGLYGLAQGSLQFLPTYLDNHFLPLTLTAEIIFPVELMMPYESASSELI
jgi:hypothetical protein